MQYLRILQNEKKIELNQFQFNKSQNQITISSEDGLISLVVQTPFNLSKIPDNLFDITRDIDSILTMRNKHFGEYNLINLKHRNNKESNALGSLFSLSGALIYDEYFKNNKHLGLATKNWTIS